MESDPPPYSYIAYIDEAGDPGLRKVKPRTPNGSSEWIVIAGALIPAELEPEMGTWVQELMKAIASRQMKDIHFQKLNDYRKADVCRILATKRVKLFAVVSNKQTWRAIITLPPRRFLQTAGFTVGSHVSFWRE